MWQTSAWGSWRLWLANLTKIQMQLAWNVISQIEQLSLILQEKFSISVWLMESVLSWLAWRYLWATTSDIMEWKQQTSCSSTVQTVATLEMFPPHNICSGQRSGGREAGCYFPRRPRSNRRLNLGGSRCICCCHVTFHYLLLVFRSAADPWDTAASKRWWSKVAEKILPQAMHCW